MSEQLVSSPIDHQQLARNWQFDSSGELAETDSSQFMRGIGHVAIDFLKQPGLIEDPEMAHAIGNEVNVLVDQAMIDNVKPNADDQREIDRIDALVPKNEQHAANLARARKQIEQKLVDQGDGQPKELWNSSPVVKAVSKEMAEHEKETVEQAVAARIEADKLPWTMPKSEIPKELIANYKMYYDSLTRVVEPKPDDRFHVGPPMGGDGYDAADLDLFNKAGMPNVPIDDINFKRKDLQAAGIFFVNRIGGGEQPIFGMPIPDGKGGDFNVQDRCFLTREEFDKVYTWQQENGYGVGDHDPADVQLDMFWSLLHMRNRGNIQVTGSGSGRESKYGEPRSPFADLGFIVDRGVEGMAVDYVDDSFGKGHRRINTMTLHLLNGHPDYPGVSEMFTDEKSQGDQRYMTPAEFIKLLYQPLPTKEEALLAVTDNLQTQREHEWVGRTRLTDINCKEIGIDPNDIG